MPASATWLKADRPVPTNEWRHIPGFDVNAKLVSRKPYLNVLLTDAISGQDDPYELQEPAPGFLEALGKAFGATFTEA